MIIEYSSKKSGSLGSSQKSSFKPVSSVKSFNQGNSYAPIAGSRLF